MNALAALVWCGIVAARPVAAPCPMGGHGERHRDVPGAPSLTHGSHGQPVGAVGANEANPVTTKGSPIDSESSQHACDCLAHCCAPAAALPQAFADVVAPIERDVKTAAPIAPTHYVAAWVDFVLPFSIAPPVSART